MKLNYYTHLNLKDPADLNTIETKWTNVDSKQTADMDQLSIEQYQVSTNLLLISYEHILIYLYV